MWFELNFNREGLAIAVDLSLPERGNTFRLTQIIEWRGKTESKFAADMAQSLLVKLWASLGQKNEYLELVVFQPATQQQNAYVEAILSHGSLWWLATISIRKFKESSSSKH